MGEALDHFLRSSTHLQRCVGAMQPRRPTLKQQNNEEYSISTITTAALTLNKASMGGGGGGSGTSPDFPAAGTVVAATTSERMRARRDSRESGLRSTARWARATAAPPLPRAALAWEEASGVLTHDVIDGDWRRTSASAASPVADIPPPPSPLQISVAISIHFLERACDNSVCKRTRRSRNAYSVAVNDN
jgi:hypothetical protein